MHQLIYLVNGPENFDLLDELNLPFPVPNNKYTSELFNFTPSCTNNFSFNRHLSTRVLFKKYRLGLFPSFSIYALHTDWLWAIYFC